MHGLINNIIDTAYNNDAVYCKYISDSISKLGFMVWFELEQENRGCIFCSDINERYGEDAMLVVSKKFMQQFDALFNRYFATPLTPETPRKLISEMDNVLTLENIWVKNAKTGEYIIGSCFDNIQLKITSDNDGYESH